MDLRITYAYHFLMADLLLTPKQKALLDFITSFRGQHGYAPSQHEIARHFGFKSLGTVQNYLVRLERQGALRKTWNARRGTQVIQNSAPQPLSYAPTAHALPTNLRTMDGRRQFEEQSLAPHAIPLPLLGRVAAGRPIEAVQHEETIEVPPSMIKTGAHFVLKVNGDSMIEQGILDGDFVVIKKQVTANNGQTVVALIDNGATIKKYICRSGSIELHPANSAYKPIIVGAESDFRIEGILVGVVRVLKH